MPGDGGATLIQLDMTPAQAKEYRAAELAGLGVVNYAVSDEEVD